MSQVFFSKIFSETYFHRPNIFFLLIKKCFGLRCSVGPQI
jgi:hypothetical protein